MPSPKELLLRLPRIVVMSRDAFESACPRLSDETGHSRYCQMKKFGTHAVISIRTPGSLTPGVGRCPARASLLHVAADDFENRAYEGCKLTLRRVHLFHHSDATRILTFAYRVKDRVDTIVCQCEGGLTQGPAVARALSILFHGSEGLLTGYTSANSRVMGLLLEVGKSWSVPAETFASENVEDEYFDVLE